LSPVVCPKDAAGELRLSRTDEPNDAGDLAVAQVDVNRLGAAQELDPLKVQCYLRAALLDKVAHLVQGRLAKHRPHRLRHVERCPLAALHLAVTEHHEVVGYLVDLAQAVGHVKDCHAF